MSSSSGIDLPSFQEASRCDVCKCSFNTFRRRHHCRACGRTLCHEHSANQMTLPQYGIFSNVRVCSDCFNNCSRLGMNSPSAANLVGAMADDMSRLDVGDSIDTKSRMAMENPMLTTPDCKCGMPLCICEPVSPDPTPEVKKDIPPPQPNLKPKKATSMQKTSESVLGNAASSSSRQSTFFNVGPTNRSNTHDAHEYEVNGEGLREAIKNGDAKAVKRLLNQGVNPNYRDKQGLSLLHLAAVFNQTEIVFILMELGASVECKNAQGETPLDCAPTMLQYKMRQKMQENSALNVSGLSSG